MCVFHYCLANVMFLIGVFVNYIITRSKQYDDTQKKNKKNDNPQKEKLKTTVTQSIRDNLYQNIDY